MYKLCCSDSDERPRSKSEWTWWSKWNTRSRSFSGLLHRV